MKESLISFETAKLAKEKGFNIFCNNVYNNHGSLFIFNSGLLKNHVKIPAPTQNLLQAWLRNKGIEVVVRKSQVLEFDTGKISEFYNVTINNWNDIISTHDGTGLQMPNHKHIKLEKRRSYEDSLEKGLLIALNMIDEDKVSEDKDS